MNKDGEIIVIEDDEDDQFLMEEAFEFLNYNNKRKYFSDGVSALEYLHSSEDLPFLILSDINMPMLNGFEVREKLYRDTTLAIKCIPYLFFSTAADQQMVIKAYDAAAQGFFVKKTNFEELVDSLRAIVEYWKKCAVPNDF